MERQRTLTSEERERLRRVADRDEPTTVLIHGEGEHRYISLYAEGTRLEARIHYPAAADG
jgi:hypothetical protein